MQFLQDPGLLRQASLVNNVWITATANENFAVENPVDGGVIAHIPKLTRSQVNESIDVAATAFNSWKLTLASERSELLLSWHALILQSAEDLARLITLEQGKPLKEAKAEVAYAASYLKWFAEEILRPCGELTPGLKENQKVLTQHQPIGVCGCISPWNFPIAMLLRKMAAALAAGCPVVAKPSELTPLSALACAELAIRAGFPKGVCNWVIADAELVGQCFTKSSLMKKISFTGSTRVGRWLMENSAPRLHKLSLELGGNAPGIVFEDADIETAINAIMAAKFRNNGQTCICINRLYVHDSVYEQVIERLAHCVKNLKVGDGASEGVQAGPLINFAAREKFQAHLNDALENGAEQVCQASIEESVDSEKGYFVRPTLLRDACHGMLFCREETFGPLLAVIPFSSESQVVQWANDTDAGLASYLFTRDLSRAMRISDQLEFGMVGINEGAISNAAAPFGGVKQSGFGREGAREGLREYQVLKYALLSY